MVKRYCLSLLPPGLPPPWPPTIISIFFINKEKEINIYYFEVSFHHSPNRDCVSHKSKPNPFIVDFI